jgi:DNA invertase Pin-like site-specific DNA recombinase
MTVYGYARVSSLAQGLTTQVAALTAAGAERIYKEKLSGKNAERPQLQILLRKVMPGDVVLVTKVDRLARSTRDLLNIIAELDEAGVGFRSLGDPIDTTALHGRLTLQILGAIGEFERGLIRSRTDEGRRAALAQGVRFGRKSLLTAHQKQVARMRLETGELPAAIARDLGVSRQTVWRLRPS